MGQLEEQLKEIGKERGKILRKIDENNKIKEIECCACGKNHEIGALTAIQTHWYTPPRGCTEGDYWNEGELQFVCPDTGIKNRLLFDVPYEDREDYDKNPESQFKNSYLRLFKQIEKTYEGAHSGNWVNNFYVDKNREMFGLVEKNKNSKERG